MKLDVSDLLDYVYSEKMLYASDTSRKLRLYVTLTGQYQVEKDGEIVFKTMQPYEAVENYNEL